MKRPALEKIHASDAWSVQDEADIFDWIAYLEKTINAGPIPYDLIMQLPVEEDAQ